MSDDVVIAVSNDSVVLASSSDAGSDSSGLYSLELASDTDAVLTSTVNQHLYNIELLLVILVIFFVCFVVHVMFRGMFSKLSGKD